MLNSHIRFTDNADEEYAPSDSEDEYDENEKELLKKVRNRGPKHSDSEEEVYGLESDVEDDQSDIALSDVEGQAQDEDDLPNNRAWGKDKRKFYKTDYVDPDYGGYQGKDAFLAEIEEEEAKNLQKQLIQQMDDEDFMLDAFSNKEKSEDKVETEEIIKTDVSKLSTRQKLQLLQKESPEFFDLVEDFKGTQIPTQLNKFEGILGGTKSQLVLSADVLSSLAKELPQGCLYCCLVIKRGGSSNSPSARKDEMLTEIKITTVRDHLHPVMKLQKKGDIKHSDAVKCVRTHYELILNYCTNICMYLLLKASRINLQNHPIVKRLFQYRQLLLQLEPVFEKVIKPQIEMILKENEAASEVEPKKNKKTLKLLSELKKNVKDRDSTSEKYSDSEEPLRKKQKKKKLEIENAMEATKSDERSVDDSDEEINEKVQEENVNDVVDGKRAITYQMAKNKGLTPHRKKEQRNPRVKHRNKFRKAKIRRKGAVRDVRTETFRYGGEISGIKASAVKSIKIKS